MMKTADELYITPVREPRGEGNGWDECAEDEATMFEVGNDWEVVEAFETRAEAEQFVRDQKTA